MKKQGRASKKERDLERSTDRQLRGTGMEAEAKKAECDGGKRSSSQLWRA